MPKILVVDEDLYVLKRYSELFSKAGFETHTAGDATSAIARFVEVKPDLVILDVEMPCGGGRMVLESLRENFMSKVPVLFATENPDPVIDLSGHSEVYVVKKVFHTQDLTDIIKKILKIEDAPAKTEEDPTTHKGWD